MTIFFKDAHFPKDVILHAVFFYMRYGVSYRDLEEIMADGGVDLDHATPNRWVGGGVANYETQLTNMCDLTFVPVE